MDPQDFLDNPPQRGEGKQGDIKSLWSRVRVSLQLCQSSINLANRQLVITDKPFGPAKRHQICKAMRAVLQGKHLDKWLSATDQGRAAGCISAHQASNHWIRGGKYTSFSEYRFAIKARLNLLPTRTVRKRSGEAIPDTSCPSSQDLSFCHTCVKAVNEGKLSLASGNIKDSPFVCGGFSNSKDAFARHEQTTTHKKAVEVLVTIPETTRDIGEMLSTAHAEGKKISGQCLVPIAENKRFLARQGIALRGDEDEKDSNFIQLLHLLAIKQPELINWMQQKTSKYTSACSDPK
ncbi:hypothetical protein EMCRGX_G005360 [Ephydatia muelleri]